MAIDSRTLGIIAGTTVTRAAGRLRMHLQFGRVVDELAGHFARTVLCAPVSTTDSVTASEYTLRTPGIELIPQPFHTSMLGAHRHVPGIARAYARTCREADVLFVRGLMPLSSILYYHIWRQRCLLCHWIVGNPIALLQTHRRAGRFKDWLSIAYAWQAQTVTRFGRWLTDARFICNGEELARVYRSPRTIATVSTAITPDEINVRADTCGGPSVRIMFMSYIRPEKGVEYLLDAVGHLQTARPWELHLIGLVQQFGGYRAKLDALIARYGLQDRVRWHDYVSYGPALFEQFRAADLFVLPTLSEGTPRVLVEARANSVPIVATRVGGIPTSVRDGHDGLLVPPKDPHALAAAIDRVIADGELRRMLIRNGLETARRLTVDRFVDQVLALVADEQGAAWPKEARG